MLNLDLVTSYGLVYLASPYSKYPRGIEQAFIDISVIAARLLQEGVKVYSPIAHTHPLALYSGLDPLDHNIWLTFDEAIMERSDACVVAMMEGWDTSKGVEHEIKFFQARTRPVHLLDPITLLRVI